MGKPRPRSTSPDKTLRRALMSLDVLAATLLDIRDRLESVRGVPFLSRPDFLRAIDELGYVSGELCGTRQTIGDARTEMRRRRVSKQPKSN